MTTKPETTLYLMRHAELQWDRRTPELEWPLTERGHRQARDAVSVLADLEIDVVFSSPALRAKATAEPFCEHASLTLHVDRDLRERQLCYPPPPPAEIEHHYRRSWEDFDYKITGFESNRDGQKRFVGALRRIVTEHAGGRVLVCTHGNVIVLALHAFGERVNAAEEYIEFCEVRRLRAGSVWRYDADFRRTIGAR